VKIEVVANPRRADILDVQVLERDLLDIQQGERAVGTDGGGCAGFGNALLCRARPEEVQLFAPSARL